MKKAKVEFPVYESSLESWNLQKHQQTSSIEEIENQMDAWLQERRLKKKV